MIISKRFKRIFIFVSLSCLFYLCTTFGYKMGRKQNLDDNQALKEVGALDSKQVINKDTIIKTTYFFTKCAHTYSETTKPTEDMLGLSIIDFKQRFADYSIDEFSSDSIILKKRFDAYCDKHYLLKMIGSRAMILTFDYESEDYAVIQTTSLFADQLDAETLKILQQGMLFNAISDIDKYILSIKN